MLLAMKDEAGSNLKDEENDFMLDNSYRDETLEELTVAVIMMARIQPTNDNAMIEPNYDAKAVSEVNSSHKMIPTGVHEHKNHGKRKIVVNTSNDDQIDSNIIFNDPYVENNSGSTEHDSWVPISQTTKENGITTLKMSTPVTAKEKTKKKNDVKARGLLLMALPKEHQLTFS
ncbi:hypothetical protein Tco_1108186 [Tanacetum coccineum]